MMLKIVVYDRCRRIGDTLSLDDLAEIEIGDWDAMLDFKIAYDYVTSQDWLTVRANILTLTTAWLRAV